MALPRRKHSKSRTRRRKSNYKIKLINISKDNYNNSIHIRHNASWINNKLVYKKKIILIK